MVSCFLTVVNGTVGTALAGSGRMWIGTAMNIFWAATLITGAYFMVPAWGALGLAAAYLLAYLLHTVWQMSYVEIKLAPTAVSSRWKLILFSIILLAAGMYAVLTATDTYLSSITLLLLSMSPAILFIIRGLGTKPGTISKLNIS
jgi:hypothetical protein